MADFRDGLLRHLESRGTPKAVNAIRRVKDELPHLDWLKWVVLDAQTAMIRYTWSPPNPSELLKLVADPRRRLVESGEQLLEVIIGSLQRAQNKLQGHTPAAPFLWDTVVYRPKSEAVFSDWVKLHLQDDLSGRGIIVNREVEVYRRTESGIGERTDIHVDAVLEAPRENRIERITLVIECKGCWNPELNTAMETQLRDKYLHEGSCRHGLYLVGWFNCEKWDPGDSRKPPNMTIEEARQQFEQQAAQLSQEGFVIKAFVLDVRLGRGCNPNVISCS